MKTVIFKKKPNAFKNSTDSSIPVVPMDNIEQWQCATKNGNTLSVFYNRDTNLVVVDLVASNDQGGNEIVRLTIDEDLLLEHTK